MRNRPALFASVLLFVLLPLAVNPPARGASRPAVVGTGGAVVSEHAEATAAGLEILRSGGNAVDAAVATALALAVVFPEAGNLGGGGFAVIKTGNVVETLDFREVGPAAATHDMYLNEKGEAVPEASLVGPLASGVPGSPFGLFALHQRLGRLPWAVVVEPARRLAAQGFLVDSRLNRVLKGDEDLLRRFPETREVWFPGGEPPAVGSRLRLPELAATLGQYAKLGPAAFREGPIAEAIEEASARHGGILKVSDLAAYQPVWRPPVLFEAFGWQVASMGLPSSGGVILAETTAFLEDLHWLDQPRFGARRSHLLLEGFRRAYADRYRLGDPETSEVQPAELLSAAARDRRKASFQADRATVSSALQEVPTTAVGESDDTTHLSTVDGDGQIVALTTTLNGLFGCGLYVPGAGLFLNNEMDDFAAAPGQPNMFGLVQGEANAVRPGKRMLSSMSPTIAWRQAPEGLEAIALGGRGGSRIPTNTLQVLLNVIADGDALQAALDRPRFHHQWLPDEAQAEPDALGPEGQELLKSWGHVLDLTPRTALVHAVRLLPGGQVEAAQDPRIPSASAGVVQPAL